MFEKNNADRPLLTLGGESGTDTPLARINSQGDIIYTPRSQIVIQSRKPATQIMSSLTKFEDEYRSTFHYIYSAVILVSMLFHALLTKGLADFPTVELLFIRSVFSLALMHFYTQKVDPSISWFEHRLNRKMLIVSVISVFGQLFYLQGLGHTSLVEGLTIMLASQIFVPFLEFIIFGGDKPDTVHFTNLSLIITGFVLIWRPSFFFSHSSEGEENEDSASFNQWGAILCLLQSVAVALSSTVKKETETSIPLTAFLVQSLLVTAALTFVMCIFTSLQWPSWLHFFELVMMSLSYFVSHILMSRTNPDSSKKQYYIQLIWGSQVIIGLVFDFALLFDLPPLSGFIGVLFILGPWIYSLNLKRANAY